MVHWFGEMKHIIIALVAVLSVLHRDQLLTTAVGCPRRYLRRINGKCYYFSVKKLNWFGALNNCLRKGLTLADLSNPRDFNGAIDFLSSKGNTEDFWFGANDLQNEGRFQYISNGRLVRYYGNYSIVEPAEHSECDDCLEVRIRNNLTVVADDNCLERQYFICSERYCEYGGPGKPRHHSHEHLHHFHHDIGEPSEEEGVQSEEATLVTKEESRMETVESQSEEYANPPCVECTSNIIISPTTRIMNAEEGTSTSEAPPQNGPEGSQTEGRQAPAPFNGESPVEVEPAPGDGAETPPEGRIAPAEGAESPAEEAQAPPERAIAPAEGAQAPAEGAETPPEGRIAPAEGAETPPEGRIAPAEGAETPAEGAQAPPERAIAPAEGAQAPAEGAETPPEGAQAPPEGAQSPPEGAQAPPEGAQAPPEGAQAPPEGAQAPPEGAQAPPEGAQAPPEGAQAPPEGAENQVEGHEVASE